MAFEDVGVLLRRDAGGVRMGSPRGDRYAVGLFFDHAGVGYLPAALAIRLAGLTGGMTGQMAGRPRLAEFRSPNRYFLLVSAVLLLASRYGGDRA